MRPSKVDRLPLEIRDTIADLRREGRTIDEILAHLQALGGPAAEIKRTGLGVHLKKWDAVAQRLNGSRQAAEAIMSRFENQGADDRMARLNVQLLHSSIMAIQAGEDGEGAALDPKEAMQLSMAVKNLVQAARTDQNRYVETLELLEEERKRAEQVRKMAEEALADEEGRGNRKLDAALAALEAIRRAYGVA